MKEQIVEHIAKNKLRLKSELAPIRRELAELLQREVPDFHDLIKKQYSDKIHGHIVRDLSMNLGIDYETSTIELESVNLDEVLK